LNSVKIKGSHTAMKSGMLAAEAIAELFFAVPEGEEKPAGCYQCPFCTAQLPSLYPALL
jgi:heterodisulfide reductase subunit C